jgi:hypothetical protein
VLLLLSTALVVHIPGVLACSGYPHFGVDDLPTMDLLIKATVIEVDDRGDSAIMLVENYYKGKGGRLLAVMRYRPALYSGARVRGYDTGCLYAGQGASLFEGGQGYFGLMDNGNGTFTDYNGGTANFYPVDGKITYQKGYTEGYAAEFDEPLTITEEEFVEKLLEVGGLKEPVAPIPNFYPLMRF